MNHWAVSDIGRILGGRAIVPAAAAPLGSTLPYRRDAGQTPAATGGVEQATRRGWTVDLGARGLGDTLLALGLVQALTDGVGLADVPYYRGPRPELLRRCDLPLHVAHADGPHRVTAGQGDGLVTRGIPEEPAARLDVLDAGQIEVHAALPMRYYLEIERLLGIRLPASHAPLPTFTAAQRARPFHVVFVSATSWSDRKDYGASGFTQVARTLIDRLAAPWSFSLITGNDALAARDDITVLHGLDAVDCLDVFASAALVIGNDTGLTHLAALTRRHDGSRPPVIGLYGRHAYNKWTTGADNHHAVATPFSRMLSAADRCPVRDRLDDALWGDTARLAAIPATVIAEFAGQVTGWW